MLPLWILDLTSQSDRRDEFRRLVGQIDHVTLDIKETEKEDSSISEEEDKKQASALSYQRYDDNVSENVEDNVVVVNNTTTSIENGNSKTTKLPEVSADEVRIREEDQKMADRLSKKTGYYWYYSSLNYDEFFDEEFTCPLVNSSESIQESDEGGETTSSLTQLMEKRASKVYDFQEAIIKQAKKFIRILRQSNARPYQPINIVVLGDVTEHLTRLLFASIAAILQKEKGRFLPSHIHQGMSITGMLFIPCDINTRHIKERKSILRLFNEIEVQHNITNIRGYDHVMLYQDVQNRTECHYPLLDEKQQAQYLLQCIVNMYWACDIHHPLLSGTGSSDTFYFSMGATSLYFDMSLEDENDAKRVADQMLAKFKATSKHESEGLDLQLLKPELYEAKIFISDKLVDKLIIDETDNQPFKPHPIWDFFHKKLKRLYYFAKLRYFPAKLLHDILMQIDKKTSDLLETISKNCINNFKTAEISIVPSIKDIIGKINERHGGLAFIEYSIKKFQNHLSDEKNNIRRAINSGFWSKIIDDHPVLPKNQMQHFEEYHETYLNDVNAKNGGAGCNELKEDELNKLKNLLGREKTILGTLSRCFLLGVMCVLVLVPTLNFISPRIINLGDINKHATIWGAVVFLLPLLWQLVAYHLYLRKRNKLVRTIKAYYTHDAYSRLANRIETEANNFYDKMINLAQEYLTRCSKIRTELFFKRPFADSLSLIPRTMFNQPLNGGEFNDDVIISKKEIEGCRIRVNYEPRDINELSDSHYFLLINHMKNEFTLLFEDVSLISNTARRYDEKTGTDIVLSRKEQEEKQRIQWEKKKKLFKTNLQESIKKEILPREAPTVGEKLLQYERRNNKNDFLNSMIDFSAVNGEVVSEFDTEYADVKVNKDISSLIHTMPLNKHQQIVPYDEIYKKFIFITRWRCFERLSFNRILPEEDFDLSMRQERVFTDEQRLKRKKAIEEKFKNDEVTKKAELAKLEDSDAIIIDEEEEMADYLSSIILWAVCPDENSSVWLRLFHSSIFGQAFDHREIFREKLNLLD